MTRSYPALRDGAMLAAVRAMSCSVLSSESKTEYQPWLSWSVIGGLTLLYALVVRGNPGRALFIVLLLLMRWRSYVSHCTQSLSPSLSS